MFATVAAAQWLPQGAGLEAGAVAPAGVWSVAGGAASGSGAAATRLFDGEPEVAWSVRPGGAIEGEPLVWEDRALVAVRASPSRAELVTLSLATGEEPVPRRVVSSPLDPAPSLWGSVLAWRAAPGAVEVARWGRGRVIGLAALRAQEPISPPLVFEGEVYVASDEGLARYAPGRSSPDWSIPGRYRGRPALRGARVYAVQLDDQGDAYLTSVDRADGGNGVHVYVGGTAGADALAPDDVRVVALDGGVYVRAGDALRVNGEHLLTWVGVPRPVPGGGAFDLLPWTQTFRSPPVRDGAGWVAQLLDEAGDPMLARVARAAGEPALVLARSPQHGVWTDDSVPPSVAGGALLVGGRAVDLVSRRVRWERGGTDRRAVPAREAVLVVEGAALTLLRPARPAGAPLVLGATGSFAGTVVRGDGAVETGAQLYVGADGALEMDGARVAPGAVRYVEDLLGAPRWAHGEDGLVGGLTRLLEAELAEGFADLAVRARRTNDPALIDRLLREAVLRGAEGRLVERARDGLDELARTPRDVVGSQVTLVLADEADLRARPAAAAWERFAALPPGAPPRAALALLELALAADPGHPEAGAEVLRRMPPEARPATSTDALDWIAFLRASLEVSVVAGPAPQAAKDAWRDDLVAFRSPRLLVLSPRERPGAIARCLSVGELVCEAVDALIGPPGPLEEPLEVHLFPSRAEYVAAGGTAGHGSDLSWTSGHYDAGADVSRLYLPGEGEGLDEALRTFAHELTHHLLAHRLGAQTDGLLPWYWIVEGIASCVEEFHFDPVARTWDEQARRSERLDATLSAPEAARVDWSRLFAMHHAEFLALPPGEPVLVPLRWVLGEGRMLTARHLFYHQAATATRYLLLGENGAHRDALVEYLRAQHAGDRASLDAGAHFGVDPEELGRRALEYAAGEVGGG